MWVWLADHDLDSGGSQQISLWSNGGIMSESQGPVWLIGTGAYMLPAGRLTDSAHAVFDCSSG